MIIYDKKEEKIKNVDEPHECINHCKKCMFHILRETEIRYYNYLLKTKSK